MRNGITKYRPPTPEGGKACNRQREQEKGSTGMGVRRGEAQVTSLTFKREE